MLMEYNNAVIDTLSSPSKGGYKVVNDTSINVVKLFG